MSDSSASRARNFVVPPEFRPHLCKRPRTGSPNLNAASSSTENLHLPKVSYSDNSDYGHVDESNTDSNAGSESEISIVESLAPALAKDSELEYCDTDMDDTDAENDGPAPGIQPPLSYMSKGPADISRTSCDDPIIVKPPRGGYPKSVNAGKERRERSFQPGWAKSYKWLEYSLSADMIYCHRCRHFGDGSLPAWEGEGTRAGGWKKATDKLKEHNRHFLKRSEVMYTDWKQSQKNGGIRGMVLQGVEKTAMDNRINISSVAEVVNFCGRQAFPLRGHDESASSDNRGNFIELLDLVGQHDLVVRKKLSAKRAFYTSPQIQNEMIQIQAGLIQNDLAAEVREAGMFSLLADESKDLGKHDQVSISVRYWLSGAVSEAFLSFVRPEALTAESLTADIVKAVENIGLSLLNCVSQSYDGAAVMSVSTSGVQARIATLSGGRALFVHCSAHRLNLAVVGAILQISQSADLFKQLSLLYSYMATSVVYTKYEDLRGGVNRLTLQRLSDTRWVCQYAACHNARVNIGVVVDVLEFYISTNGAQDADRRSHGLMLMGFIDTVWVMELCIMEEVLARLKHLHLTLQSEQLDLASAKLMIEGLVEHCSTEVATLSAGNGASTEAWSIIYAKFMEVLNIVNLPTPRARPVRRARKDAAADVVVVYDTEEDYRQKLYLPIVNAVCEELKRRFRGGTHVAFGGIDSLHPASPNFISMDGPLLSIMGLTWIPFVTMCPHTIPL